MSRGTNFATQLMCLYTISPFSRTENTSCGDRRIDVALLNVKRQLSALSLIECIMWWLVTRYTVTLKEASHLSM